jgi:hypothetical protein
MRSSKKKEKPLITLDMPTILKDNIDLHSLGVSASAIRNSNVVHARHIKKATKNAVFITDDRGKERMLEDSMQDRLDDQIEKSKRLYDAKVKKPSKKKEKDAEKLSQQIHSLSGYVKPVVPIDKEQEDVDAYIGDICSSGDQSSSLTDNTDNGLFTFKYCGDNDIDRTCPSNNKVILIGRASIIVPLSLIPMALDKVKSVLSRSFTIRYQQNYSKFVKTARMYIIINNVLILPKASLLEAAKYNLVDLSKVRVVKYRNVVEQMTQKDSLGVYIDAYDNDSEPVDSAMDDVKRLQEDAKIPERLTCNNIDGNISGFKPNEPSLYYNQVVACNFLMEHIFSKCLASPPTHVGGCILIAPTGEGKTHIMMGLFHRIGGKALIIVPNKVILKQTVEVALTAFPEGPNKPSVTTFYGENKDMSGDIVVSIINTTSMQGPSFFSVFTFICYDEAPDYCSSEFSKVFWKAQATCTMAVTATPSDRPDGFDKMLTYHIGPIVDVRQMPGFEASNDNFTYSFNILNYVGPPKYTIAAGTSKTGISGIYTTLRNISLDPYRCALIISRIKLHYEQGRHIYVFCNYRLHCFILSKILARVMPELGFEINDDQANAMNANYSEFNSEYTKETIDLYDRIANGEDADSKEIVTGKELEMITKKPGEHTMMNRLIDAGMDKDNTTGNVYGFADEFKKSDDIDAADVELYDDEGNDAVDINDQVADVMGSKTKDKCNFYIVMGGASQSILKQAYDNNINRSIVFTTYMYLRRGVSIPRMDTIILASPQKTSTTQIIGRISRRGGDTSKIRIVDDIVDTRTITNAQVTHRIESYKLRKGNIYMIPKISWEQITGDIVDDAIAVCSAEEKILKDKKESEKKELMEIARRLYVVGN